MKNPSPKTIRRLFALSNNKCAFPGCNTPIIAKNGIMLGKICHIKAISPNGPRFDSNQSQEKRHSFSNLILLCGVHHDIIDKNPNIYTAELLTKMKNDHERNGRIEIKEEDLLFARKILNEYKNRNIKIIDNSGNILIDSPGAIQAEKLTIKSEKKKINILPPKGTISYVKEYRNYTKYLIDKYIDFASKDNTRKTEFKYSVIYSSIKKEFGAKWDLISIKCFEELTSFLQKKIDNTRLGRINKGKDIRSYRSFKEYKKEKLRIE